MTRQRLILTVILSILLLVGFNVLLAVGTRNSPEKKALMDLRGLTGKDTIAFGDSLIGVGFLPDIFDRTAAENAYTATSANAAVLNTYPSEHAIVLGETLRLNPQARMIIYGFFDFRLTAVPAAKSDDLWGNRIIGLLLEPLKAQSLYTMDLGSRIETVLFSKLPLFTDRATPYFRVEKARESLAKIGKSPAPAGGATRFAQLEATSIENFNREALQQVSDRQPLSTPILEIIRQAKEHNARLVLVEMPASPEHVTRFYRSPSWAIYREYVRGLLKEHGVEFLDAGEWFPEQGFFGDELHLAPRGAQAFSQQLARSLAASPVKQDP